MATTGHSYDEAGRLTGIGHFGPSLSPYIAHEYEYDQANRITSYTYARSGGGLSNANRTATFDYDARDQLIEDDRASTSNDRTYTYDDNGNRTAVNSTTWTTGDNNQLTDDGTFEYEYDDEGNRTSRTRISSATSDSKFATYDYDHRNRLIKVTFEDNDHEVTETLDYIYDAFDRLVRRTHDADGEESGAATDTFFIWDGHDSILEFDDNGSTDISRRSLYGPAVDMLLAEEEVTSTSSSGTTRWALADNLGSVRDIVEYNTGTSTTTIVNSIDYDAFGRRLSQTDGNVQVRPGYAGYFRDETTGWYLTQTRWYDPVTAKWNTEDWIGFESRDPNLARYVENSATDYTDPDGLQARPNVRPSYDRRPPNQIRPAGSGQQQDQPGGKGPKPPPRPPRGVNCYGETMPGGDILESIRYRQACRDWALQLRLNRAIREQAEREAIAREILRQMPQEPLRPPGRPQNGAGPENINIPGSVRLGEVDQLGRPTTARATITPEQVQAGGSPASSRIKPPGYVSNAGYARGHLIANMLGGSGKDPRNLVTIQQNRCNVPLMRDFESRVRDAGRRQLSIATELLGVVNSQSQQSCSKTSAGVR